MLSLKTRFRNSLSLITRFRNSLSLKTWFRNSLPRSSGMLLPWPRTYNSKSAGVLYVVRAEQKFAKEV